ncbi:MAG TPA: hypothetical protein VGX23_32300 [Actinocrinis sp.]|nr:hypothetical protein [Actinocrinis sp.]
MSEDTDRILTEHGAAAKHSTVPGVPPEQQLRPYLAAGDRAEGQVDADAGAGQREEGAEAGESGEVGEDWDIVHVGAADTPDHGAQALMRTSDGDFRISAAEVDGKVGLKIERFHPHETLDGDHAADPGAADHETGSTTDGSTSDNSTSDGSSTD